MKDVDQTTGRDLTPHLRIKSESELDQERQELAQRASSGANAMPLGGKGSDPPTSTVRSAKRLTSPERWEIKQLISSGVIDASEYPELDEEFNSPAAKAEIEEELDVEIREDEPSFLAGQTKRTLDLSPVRIVKAPDGSLNRAALAGTSLAKERRELRQQETNEQADSEARDFGSTMVGSNGHVTRPHVRAGLEGEHRRSKGTGRSTMACPGFQQSDDIRQNHRLKHYRPAEKFTYLPFPRSFSPSGARREYSPFLYKAITV